MGGVEVVTIVVIQSVLPTGQAAVFTEPAGGELVDARRDKIIAGGDGFRVFWWRVEIKIPDHERAVGAHPRNGAISARRHLFERGHADIIHGRDAEVFVTTQRT